MKYKRMVGLDVFRILAALLVFFFHSFAHMNCYYGLFQPFVRMGPIIMTGFFMLSGFSLYIGYCNKSLMEIENLKIFYLKRFIGIMPVYYVFSLIYTLFLGKETFAENVVLAPIEILGLQSTMESLFSLSHNTGTWFISCLVIFYLFYPFMQEVLKQIPLKYKMMLIIMSYLILAWIAVVVWKFKLEKIYTNPVFRGFEFFIGVAFAACKDEFEKKKVSNLLYRWSVFLIEVVLLIGIVTVGVKIDFAVGNYMTYDMFCLPIFGLMLITLSGVSSPCLERSKMLKYLSGASYVFFLAQFFTWEVTKTILVYFNLENNYVKIVLSFGICVMITFLLYEFVEKPLKKLCNKKLLEKRMIL